MPSALLRSRWRVEHSCARILKTASPTWQDCPVTIADFQGDLRAGFLAAGTSTIQLHILDRVSARDGHFPEFPEYANRDLAALEV